MQTIHVGSFRERSQRNPSAGTARGSLKILSENVRDSPDEMKIGEDGVTRHCCLWLFDVDNSTLQIFF